jgi:hypothetical protein
MHFRHALSVMGALRFIKYQQVLRRHDVLTTAVVLDVLLDAANKCPSATAAVAKRVLKHFDKGPIARQVNPRRRRLAPVRPNFSKIIKPSRMNKLKPNERLA